MYTDEDYDAQEPLSPPAPTYPAPTFWQQDCRWHRVLRRIFRGR